MAASFTKNIDKIVFTSPNMPSPSPAGTRSHIIPDTMDLGTWYESGGSMYRAALQQNIYDNSYNQGIDRPVFGYSGIVASGTSFIEDATNYIYVYTTQDWLTTVPFNLYLDDNSWFKITEVNTYEYAPDPPQAPSLLPTTFTSSGILDTTRNVIVNGCVCYYSNLNYIFNTKQLYTFDLTTKSYTYLSTTPYTLDYPVCMEGYNNNIYVFYISNNLLRCISYNTISNNWTANAYTTLQQETTGHSEIGCYLVGSKIYVCPKYDESSIPSHIYIYIYDITGNSWSNELVDICGEYNLNISDSMLASDGSYLYILERYSRLLHKINLSSKTDTQMVIASDTEANSSMVMLGDTLYIYNPTNNVFENIKVTNGQTQSLNPPTIKDVDNVDIEGTLLSTDGTYIYLSFNKGVEWVNDTWLYQYDKGANSWSYLSVPSAGSVSFTGNLCSHGSDMFGIDNDNIYQYSSSVGSWKLITKLPREDADDAIICCDGTYIYVLINQCGFFWRYHLADKQWNVLQSVSLPSPTAYEGVRPGYMVLNGTDIYMGLYYNYVTATRDTFYYKYDTTNDVWTTYVAPKTSINRSFYMYPYIDNGDLMLAGCVQYISGSTTTYRYTIYHRTDAANNTWVEYKTIDLNAVTSNKYLCMWGQLLVNGIIYINFTKSDNLGFVCQGAECRKLILASDSSDYWMPNPVCSMYMTAINTSYVYYINLDNNLFYEYNINASTTVVKSVPRKSYVNYYICMRGTTKYLFGKQEVEYNPNLYKYTFTVYRQSGTSWAVVKKHETTYGQEDELKLNPIQDYHFRTDTVYMVAYKKTNNNVLDPHHKKYKITTLTLSDLNIDNRTTSITSKDDSTLMLAVGNSAYSYDISTETATLFIEGISGNRSSAYLCVYDYGGVLRAIGGQYYTPSGGAKFITYEKSAATWSGIKEQSIPSSFYNTLDYADTTDYLYTINTTSHTKYIKATDTISYINDPPNNMSLCNTTSSGVILYSDHYGCQNYIFDGYNFTATVGDIEKTGMSSNICLVSSGTLCFIKNSVTNEVSYIDVNTNIGSTTVTNKIFGTTPFILTNSTTIYTLLPDHKELCTISGSYVNTIKNNLDISPHCTGCYNNNYIYFTKGEYTFSFYRVNVNTLIVDTLTSLPEQQSTSASLIAINDYILYITNNNLYKYSITTDTWEHINTLAYSIASKGLHQDESLLYYLSATYINTVPIHDPELESSYYGPIPVMYHGSFVRSGEVFYLHYNDKSVQDKCSIIYSDDLITSLDITTVTHQPPTSVPYNLSVSDKTEKHVVITWEVSTVINITHYRIYRREYGNSLKEYVGQSTDLEFTDTLADRGKWYYYSVKSCNAYGCTAETSNELLVKVDGSEYKYAFKTSTWDNRTKTNAELENSLVFRWGNSNIDFNNSVIITATFGEAYDCYITAWDDDTHSSTNNALLNNECYRISACAFTSSDNSNLTEPDYKAMYCYPRYNVVLKGDTSYYGKFNIPYEPSTNRYGGFIMFKPILINIPSSTMTKGKYEFVTSFHYKYT